MAVIKTPLATDSAAELHDLIGDDATAMFESDPKFIDSDPTSGSSSENVLRQRDTDDIEDSEEDEELEDNDEEEEDEELDEEDEDEEEEEEDEDDFDSDEEKEDEEEEEVGATGVLATGSTNLRGPVVNGNTSVESELEQDDDADDETMDQDEDVIEGGKDGSGGGDSPQANRAIDAALRMSALAAVTSEYAANF